MTSATRLLEKLRAICAPLGRSFRVLTNPVEVIRLIADRAIPDAELVVIPGESHFAFMENPEAFGASGSFLERVSP